MPPKKARPKETALEPAKDISKKTRKSPKKIRKSPKKAKDTPKQSTNTTEAKAITKKTRVSAIQTEEGESDTPTKARARAPQSVWSDDDVETLIHKLSEHKVVGRYTVAITRVGNNRLRCCYHFVCKNYNTGLLISTSVVTGQNHWFAEQNCCYEVLL